MAVKHRSLAIPFLVGALASAPLARAGTEDAPSVIKPGTPAAARTIKTLEAAEHRDRMNGQSYTTTFSDRACFTIIRPTLSMNCRIV